MANEYLKRTHTSTGSKKKFTYSLWFKSNIKFTSNSYFFGLGGDGSSYDDSRLYVSGGTSNALSYTASDAGVSGVITDDSIRDISSWYHFMVVVDTTIAHDNDRVKLYINGVRKDVSYGTTAAQNANISHNTAGEILLLGTYNGTTTFSAEGSYSDIFNVDGQALTPDVFGFYKDGDGYQSSGTTQATDFRPGQWSPRAPKSIKHTINRSGGFGVNGFYLPMNDSSNPGADFHCTPNSIITLKGEDLPQPQNGAPTTSDAYVSELRDDPFAANLVLAVPGIALENTNTELVTNGDFSNGTTGWTGLSGGSLSVEGDRLKITETSNALDAYGVNSSAITTEVGKRYTIKWTFHEGTNTTFTVRFGNSGNQTQAYLSNSDSQGQFSDPGTYSFDFEATGTQLNLSFIVNQASSYGYISNVSVKEAMPVRDYSADIKGSGSNKTFTSNGTAGVGYELGGYYGSAMTFDGSGDYIEIADGPDFNFGSGDWTLECWVKQDVFTDGGALISKYGPITGPSTQGSDWYLSCQANGVFAIYWYSGSNIYNISSPPNSPSVNQWHHVAACREGNTISLYVNGACSGVNNTVTYSLNNNSTAPIRIGESYDNNSYFVDGQIQDVRVYKGLAKYKGGFDVPKPYTPVGIEAFRTTADTCKNNFATLNPLYNSASGAVALVDGSLSYTGSGTYSMTQATQGVSSGKWYWEFRLGDTLGPNIGLGVMRTGTSGWSGTTPETTFISGVDGGIGFYHGVANNIYYWNGSTQVSVSYTIPACTTGDVISVALDLENGKIYYAKNGTWGNSGNPATGTNPVGLTLSGLYLPAVSTGASGTSKGEINFGQNPSFSGALTAGTNADDSGKGLFKYAPPSGFLALCEDNLPTPAIADPGKYFKAVLYTGDGNKGHQITGVGFKPDFVWLKGREGSSLNHILNDVIRGPKKTIFTNNELLEYTDRGVNSFDEDGFTLSKDGGDENASGTPYVAWCWKAGGAAVSNTDGTITSQVSANQDAGFSIATYSGSTGNYTFGHGLGIAPKFVMIKNRSVSSTPWFIITNALGNWQYGDMSAVWPGAAAQSTNSSVIDTNNNVYNWFNQSGNDYVAYSWAEIENFSKISSYVGNGDDDGPFIYCGFKPAWVLIKKTNGSGNENWRLYDSSRCPTNQNNKHLLPGIIGPETTETGIDLLSNGFKLRDDDPHQNQDGTSYIFMAFAESPFQTANAK